MPTASSIQVVNDANGAAYGFLEVDGLLWQCQWNPQAERWDKAQVVPGAYGGEKLQALLVDNLWPTSGSMGDQEGNTPGIVLAYRIGSGEAAKVYATLGKWSSVGQLSWNEPLLLSDSGNVTEAIALRSNGDGSFELISQRREPEAAEPGDALQTITGARSDSELIKQSFSLSGSDATGYQLTNKTASKPPQDVTPTKEPAPVAPASATAGSTEFSRADLLLAPSPAIALFRAPSLLEAASSGLRASANGLGSPLGIGWSGGFGIRAGNPQGQYTGVYGFGVGALGQTRARWQLVIPNSSPQSDWLPGTNFRASFEPLSDSVKAYNQGAQLGNREYKRSVGFVGAFGTYGFGTQVTRNDVGITYIIEGKKERGKVGEALKFAKEGYAGAILKQTRDYYTFLASLQTKYYFDSLNVFSPQGFNLEKVKNTFSATGGWDRQVRERLETGGYLQYSYGFSIGYAGQYTQKPVNTDGFLPEDLKWVGYSAAVLGPVLGLLAQGQSASNGFQNANNLNIDRAENNISLYNKFNKKGILQNAKDAKADPYEFYQGFQFLQALAGVTYAIAPPISSAIGDSTKRTGYQNGLVVRGQIGLRYLYKSIGGFYGNLRAGFYDYFNQEAFKKADGSYSPWQLKFQLDGGLAFPFGVSVPVLAVQYTTPKPYTTALASQSFGAANATGNSSIDNYAYLPAGGSTLLPNTGDSDGGVPLVVDSSNLQLFTLSNYTGGAGNSTSSPLQLVNRGSGLIPGTYEGVPILAESLPGSAGATFSFNVLGDGTLDPTSIQIKVPPSSIPSVLNGQYLFLPETSSDSRFYALIPDVFSTGILQPPADSSNLQDIRDLRTQLPVITAYGSTTSTLTPQVLTISDIVAVPQVVPVNTSTATGTTSFTNPNPSDNSLRTYKDVPVSLNVGALNTTTASVSLSNGSIVKVVLDDPFYLSSTPSTSLALTVDLLSDPDFITDYRPTAESSNPVFTVNAQVLGYSNVVEDQSYSANPGAPANSDQSTGSSQQVWLADGINDQWQQTPTQGGWPVFNRVVFGSFDRASKQWTVNYLNGSQIDSTGVKTSEAELEPANVTLASLYQNFGSEGKGPIYTFSAASTPTVITVAGQTGERFANSTAVFWVEASKPVIPVAAKGDGSTSYQNFLNQLYGSQQINYRIKKPDGTWGPPIELYAPVDAVIRHLKAFAVEMDGAARTLLVWDETSISTIKGTPPDPIAITGWIDDNRLTLTDASSGLRIGDLISGDGVKQGTLVTGIITPYDPLTQKAVYKLSTSQSLGSSFQPVALNATPLLPPTVLKAGFLNPAANSIQWSDLFSEGGSSTITTIPWDQTNDIGVGIESLSVASKQVVDASGQVRDTAVLSWSENVRTPYVESVLNDQPLIYLQFADLQPGFNDINIGSTASETTTGTSASSTGLNFTITSALSKSSGSAVQNIDGTGVIATGTGSQNSLYNSLFNSTPINQRPSSPLSQLTGTITDSTLTLTALSGELTVGDLLTGPGLAVDTQITAVLNAFDAAKGTGQYSINTAPLENITSSTAFEAVPDPAPTSSKDLGLPYASFSGSINGTTLTVSQLNGSLAVGDLVIGEGITFGTSISAVLNVDASTGLGEYQLSADPLQQGTVLAPSALIATPSSSVPYTIEFWTKLPSGSNPQGAGLVAFGQPSTEAVGPAVAPSGWLMTSTFTVQRITVQQAAAQGFQDAYDTLSSNSAKANDLYAWGWSLDATGANTTALNGNGGSNVYSNALSLTNLYSGQTIDGVTEFLNSYGLQPGDLPGGDGLDASTIDLVPGTSLDFNISLDADTGLPVSNLNAVGIDTASSLLNSGLVFARDGQLSSDPGKDQSLKDMFQALWDYQETYASAKVAFSLDPTVTGTSTTSGFEQYGGLELTFSVSPGPAISVNQEGQLVFDVADGVAITSDATSPENKRQTALPADLRDDQWHYVVATYLPTYRSYTINGVATQVPTNRGTARLYVDNQLVASQENVSNAYLATNINDTALLLPSNAGGAIDQFALYNKALLTAPPLPSNPGGLWPEPGRNEALTILKQLDYPATADTPNPGAIESAISEHWHSRDVNPNNALLATFSSSFTPSSDQPLSGSWSQAAPLNPIPELQATIPSATAPVLAQDLVIPVQGNAWSEGWTNATSTDKKSFNPGGDTLEQITVTLTPDQGDQSKLVIRQLSPLQILMGSSTTLAVLQPAATSSNLDYTFLSSEPALNLLISRKANQQGDSGDLDPGTTYTAEIKLSVDDPNEATGTAQVYTKTITGFNAKGSQVVNASNGTGSSASAASLINKRTAALATAAVIEQAPLQLKYIDSGVVLKSTTSQEAANNPATPSPAPTFGQSMAYGWFPSTEDTASEDTASAGTTYSGWLAVAQPSSANAISDPAGRVWIQYTGNFESNDPGNEPHKAVSDTATPPNTWLNALANSNFSPEAPNRPLLNDKTHPSTSGGLLVKADPTLGWGQNFAQTMLVVDINGDDVLDLVISAPSANGGGKVVIIDGEWIKDNLNNPDANLTLNLASPDNAGTHVLVLSPAAATGNNEDSSQSAFGWALAFDSTSKTLYIGAPNYSRKVGPEAESVPIGAVYQYNNTSNTFASGNKTLSNPALGLAGRTDTNDVSGPASTYWGAQLGASLAASNTGKLAIGAPGVEASLLYSGTEAVKQLEAGNKNPSAPYGQGTLIKVMLPTSQTADDVVDVYVTSDGTDNNALSEVISNNTNQKTSDLTSEESTYMSALKELQTRPIAKASPDNNSAIQTAAVGSVYLVDITSGKQLPAGTLEPSNAQATFYGPNPLNVGGATDFGASLAFGDFNNTNTKSILAVGSPSTGGPGAVYLINTSQPFGQPSTAASWIKNTNLGTNQYLAYLTSGLTLYGAEDLDQFGTGVVNLGDTNGDGYDDLLVQAPNASSGAGNGYVVFGNDKLISSLKDNQGKNSSGGQLLGGHNPASGSVKPGSIGNLTFADDSLAGNRPLTTPILSLMGYGISAATGQGSFGAGDVDANGNNDILLGSGINGQAYLAYGHDYLKAIGNLQLQKLASNTGYLLEGLATIAQGSLRSIGDFNGDGYGDYFSRQPGSLVDTVRIELGANTQDILASYSYNYYTFQVDKGTDVIPVGDVNGDGYSDIALFLQKNLTSPLQGNAGAGSTTGILYGRPSDQLPLGSGFGYLAPVSDGDATNGLTGPASNPQPINTPLTALPGLNPSGGLSNVDPSFLAVGNRIYCVVKAYDNNSLYFNQSGDGGNTWTSWTNLTDANSSFKSWNSPSLAWHQDKLYLAYLDPSNQLTLANWDPNGGDPSVWSNPTTVGDGKTVFVSRFRPQLLSDSSGLSISWVGLDGNDAGNGSLQSSISTNLDGGLWEPVASGGTSPFNPAMVRDGDKVYMARLASDNTLYWTQSTDAGQSWDDWQQLPTGMYSEDAPSLAIVNGALFLTYLGKGNQFINITKLKDATQNEWEDQVYLNNQTAKQGCGAVAIGESVNGTTGLAIYYVVNDSTGTIYRTFSASPLTTSTYSSAIKLGTQDYALGYSASGALAATTFNGATYLAYPSGTPSAPSTTANIASSAGNDPGVPTNWTNIASRDTGNTFGIGLSSNSTGLLLNTTDSATNQQAVYNLIGASGDFSFYGSRSSASISATQKTASILAVPASGSSQEVLLEAVANSSQANTVSVSTNAPLWLPQQQLLERSDNSGSSFQAITATAAPTATLLNGVPVLAVNNGGTINVYSGAGGRTFTLNSSFSPGDANAAGTTSAGLTTTATGLGLSYRNTDGSVSLQRLNFLKLDGTLVNGVVINADGSIDTSKANLQWEGINLASSSGVSTSLASTPLNVNGSLLLGSVSNSTSEQYQVQLHALPALSSPDSLTWLNTSVQLPDGKGGWLVQQQAGADHSVAIGAVDPGWQQQNNGLSPWAPSFADLNGVLYAAVRGWSSDGSNKQLYWTRSTDQGDSWQDWKALPRGMTSDRPPTIAAFDGTLYLVYICQDNDHTLNLTKLNDAEGQSGSGWAPQIPVRAGISGASNQTAEFATLVNEDGQLALYYVGTDKNKLYSTSTTDPYTSNKFTTSTLIKYNNDKDDQTASGPLAAARVGGKTYLAYQGGTYQSGNKLPGKQNGIYLTTGDANATDWTMVQNVPQPTNPSHTGVGLTANSKGLVISYSDVKAGKNVISLQQGMGSGSSWSFSPYTVLQTPSNSPGAYDGTNSLYAQPVNDRVLVSRINNLVSEAIDNAWVTPLPSTLTLSDAQTRSTLTPVGDINGDGTADMLVTAANVVVPGTGAGQLKTGVRLLTGTSDSESFKIINAANTFSQAVQIAPAQPLNANPSNTIPTAAGSAGTLPQLTISALNSSQNSRITNQADQSLSSFIATSSDPSTLNQLFAQAEATLSYEATPPLWGHPELRSSGFGDLNGDGRLDYLAPDGLDRFQTALGALGYGVWNIRAAGDVNGNGVDDVILALVPRGPAYQNIDTKEPWFIQAVLLDGSLFKIDQGSTSFSFSNLRQPLNPYSAAEVADLGSTSQTDYVPLLQAWIEPILTYKPGALSAASITNPINPSGARSYASPSAVVSPEGQTYLFFSGATGNGSTASGLWLAYQDQTGWKQKQLPIGNDARNQPPSATYYKGKLYIAYADTSRNLHVAVCNGAPEDPSTGNWNSYQVKTPEAESTGYSPTLQAEGGRLALYFPSNATNNPTSTAQTVRYLFSVDPSDAANLGNWGQTFSASTNQYTGVSGSLSSDWQVGSTIAATNFQGHTVLAFKTYASYDSPYLILTNKKTDSTSSDFVKNDQTTPSVYGIGLTTDQSLLYLTTNDGNNTAQVASITPVLDEAGTFEGQWSKPNPVKMLGFETSPSGYRSPLLMPFMNDGVLMATWSRQFGSDGLVDTVQLATLRTTVSDPIQKSLAGYSIDGNIDVNGDGFMDMLVSDPSDPSQNVDNQYVLFGGDYLNIASQVGTPGDDVMLGTPVADVIYSLQGADQVISNGGKDVIYTGAGDDLISIKDNAFIRIDAGSGFDALQLEGLANQSYDFRLNVSSPEYFAGTKLRDIELISSLDYGANQLSFDAAAINAINTDRVLFLTPDASDSITLSTEFNRNASFDTSFGGTLWSAYAAAPASATPASGNPALVYVAVPTGQTFGWLSTNVSLTDTPAAAPGSALRAAAAPAGTAASDPPSFLPTTSPIADTQVFGDGLTLLAYRTGPSTGMACFAIERSDPSKRQVVLYASSSANGSAKPGSDYTAVAGLLVFEPGQTSHEVTVAIDSVAFARLGSGSLSLQVEELQDQGQTSLHLLITPTAATAAALKSVLSSFELSAAENATSAILSFRADSTSGNPDSLQLTVSQRDRADSDGSLNSQNLQILDFGTPTAHPISSLGVPVPLDNDGRKNNQVCSRLKLNFTPASGEPFVSILGPALVLEQTVQQVGTDQIRFQQDGPLTSWRSDSGSGLLTFALQAGSTSQTLLTAASGGSVGSIDPTRALDNSPGGGWQGSEGLAVGSRSITTVANLSAQAWTPTATRDGVALNFQDISINGNQVTARFQGGVSVEFWQASGTAPSLVPIAPAVEVKCLAGYNNTIGFYSVDSITGLVDGRSPGEAGYLQAALARSEAEKLLLSAAELPAFGQSATFNALPLNSQQSYGVLLLQNGARKTMFSSFSAANPGGETQMVRLGSDPSSYVLGIEDIAVASGRSDRDFNDNILTISGVSLGLF